MLLGISFVLVGKHSKSVIRGGYSIAYDPAFYNILLNVSTSAPSVFLNTINNNTSLTAPLFRLPANPTGDVVRSNLGSFLQLNLTETARGGVRGLHAESMSKVVTVAAGAAYGVSTLLDDDKGDAKSDPKTAENSSTKKK